jgi:hypothetical protein
MNVKSPNNIANGRWDLIRRLKGSYAWRDQEKPWKMSEWQISKIEIHMQVGLYMKQEL